MMPKNSKKSTMSSGTYITPKRNVSVAVPPFWFFRQTNDDLELDSPTTNTSIVISAFQRTSRSEPLDSREYMKRFLETTPAAGTKQTSLSTKARTIARFRDGDGESWQCEFLTDGTTLLLVTLNTREKARSPEMQTGLAILNSVKILKRKG